MSGEIDWHRIDAALKARDGLLDKCCSVAPLEAGIYKLYILFGIGSEDVPQPLVRAQEDLWVALGLEELEIRHEVTI